MQGAAACSCLCFIWDCLGLLFIIFSLSLSIIFHYLTSSSAGCCGVQLSMLYLELFGIIIFHYFTIIIYYFHYLTSLPTGCCGVQLSNRQCLCFICDCLGLIFIIISLLLSIIFHYLTSSPTGCCGVQLSMLYLGLGVSLYLLLTILQQM